MPLALAAALFGADRSLLVKLSQIIQVIDPVARVVSAARALERGRKPERRDAEFGQAPRL